MLPRSQWKHPTVNSVSWAMHADFCAWYTLADKLPTVLFEWRVLSKPQLFLPRIKDLGLELCQRADYINGRETLKGEFTLGKWRAHSYVFGGYGCNMSWYGCMLCGIGRATAKTKAQIKNDFTSSCFSSFNKVCWRLEVFFLFQGARKLLYCIGGRNYFC